MLLEGGESAYHFLQMKLNCLPGSQSVRQSVPLSVCQSLCLTVSLSVPRAVHARPVSSFVCSSVQQSASRGFVMFR